MKTHLKFVIAGILAGAASLFLSAPLLARAAFGPEKFSVSVSQVSHSGKINVHIEKSSDIRLTITLRDSNGDIVSECPISKTDREFSQNYDFSLAEEGVYYLVVSDGHRRITRVITYEESQTVTMASFEIK